MSAPMTTMEALEVLIDLARNHANNGGVPSRQGLRDFSEAIWIAPAIRDACELASALERLPIAWDLRRTETEWYVWCDIDKWYPSGKAVHKTPLAALTAALAQIEGKGTTT